MIVLESAFGKESLAIKVVKVARSLNYCEYGLDVYT